MSTLLIPVGLVFAAGSPPIVNAGPATTISLPAKDLTLFGHATDPENDPLTVRWTQTTGPAPAVFSAPWALATTVTLTTPGSYQFQLAVSDGTSTTTSSTTVTLNPASSQTSFFVDPTYTGGSNDGSAARPWRMLDATAWNTINAALLPNSVIVYFSARQAGSDSPEVFTSAIRVQRTATGSNRLTLDGMSKYNANDASGNWLDYTGVNKFKIAVTNEAIGFGWDYQRGVDSKYTQNYVTLRGFEVTGYSGRVTWKGSHTVLEHLYVHDITGMGATIQYNDVTDANCTNYGPGVDITVRNNRIERGFGEGIYISGTYYAPEGCPSFGTTNTDILVENNTIVDPGYNGGQNDGIDLKVGLVNVTVRGNTVTATSPMAYGGGNGIATLGATARGNYLIERNVFRYDIANAPGGIVIQNVIGVVIRNNLLYSHGGIITGTSGGASPTTADVQICNNTTSGTGIGIGDTTGVRVRNNMLLGISSSAYQLQTYNSVGIDSDYNILNSSSIISSAWREGTHSIYLSTSAGLVVNPASGDFHLPTGSAAIGTGTNLSATGFANDLDNVQRSQSAAWDMGAYAASSSSSSAISSPPTSLQVR